MLNFCLCFDEVSPSFTLAHLLGGIACTRARDTEPIHHTLWGFQGHFPGL